MTKPDARQSKAEAPRPSLEGAITEIWSQVLGIRNIGQEDDFFDLGGTSLAMINVVLKMGETFRIPLDTEIVAKGATVASLAKEVRARQAVATPSAAAE
jgi:acyl carrier protein